jgi:putative transposase
MNEPSKRRRLNTHRWEDWDYGTGGAYFLTTCTKNRYPWFGKIESQTMLLYEFGEIVRACWEDIPNHFKDVELGEFVIMPNHVHGIIVLTKDHFYKGGNTPINEIPAQQRVKNQGKNTVSAMIGSFKSAVTRQIRLSEPRFAWQTRFHDHVIRDAGSFERISYYILNNPANWAKDEYYSIHP